MNDLTTLVADIGCGVGWAAVELAKAHPLVRVEGFDSDLASIESARRNAKEHHVHDRVTFHLTDAATWQAVGRYDLILFLECVHDFGRPVEALAAAKGALAPGGTVIIMDERCAETRPAAGDLIETFFATTSVLWCLPQGGRRT